MLLTSVRGAGAEVNGSQAYQGAAEQSPMATTSGVGTMASAIPSNNLLNLSLHAQLLSTDFISTLTSHGTKLQHLRLVECTIDPPEILLITKLTRLTFLQLSDIPVSETTVCALLTMPRLHYLVVTGSHVNCTGLNVKRPANHDLNTVESTKDMPLVALSMSGCTYSDQAIMVSFLHPRSGKLRANSIADVSPLNIFTCACMSLFISSIHQRELPRP
jgi:hypothetical protein